MNTITQELLLLASVSRVDDIRGHGLHMPDSIAGAQERLAHLARDD
jgi:hypothetical protein